MLALCKNCGSFMPEGATVCEHCGKSVATASSKVCAKCGYVLLPGLTFCPSCGTGVSDPEKATAT